jgi:hypothetical protein
MAGTLAASGGSSNPAVDEKNAGLIHMAACMDLPSLAAMQIPERSSQNIAAMRCNSCNSTPRIFAT